MKRHHTLSLSFFILYMIGLTAFMIVSGVGITPDRYVLVLLLASLFIKRSRQFLFDWAPFLFILIFYDFLRSLADDLDTRAHFLEPIKADQSLFGTLPTLSLQHLFYHGTLHWYDYLASIFYFLHFALPLAFGYILWLKSRDHFKRFSTSLLVLSYSAYITYVIYPAAPPWLASKMGYLPPVTKILDQALQSFPDRLHLPTIYYNFDPNLVAAIPSLHVAYPFLVFLFCLKLFRSQAIFFFFYTLGVWLSIVYLGEHYVIDV